MSYGGWKRWRGFLALTVAFSSMAGAADWPQWRGPDRTGHTPESSRWDEGGWPPTRLWETNVGWGCSSPVLADGALYVLGWEGAYHSHDAVPGHDILRCLDPATGRLRWQRSCPARLRSRRKAGDEHEYAGPLATPLYDARSGFLYTLSVDGDLRCWDTRRQGAPVWAVSLHDAYAILDRRDEAGSPRDYGFTASPLLLGDTLIVEVGAREGTLVGFDRKTGREVWRSQAAVAAGHSGGPALLKLSDGLALAHLALDRVLVIGAEGRRSGSTLAEIPWQTDYGCNIPSPATMGSSVLITSGYNLQAAELFDVALSPPQSLWRSRHHAAVSSPVVHEGHIYLVSGSLTCLDAATGKTLWSGGQFGHGSCLVTGDGRLIVWGENTLALVEGARRSPSACRVLATVSPVLSGSGTCYPHIALSDGRMVCRNKDGLLAALALKEGLPRSEKKAP